MPTLRCVPGDMALIIRGNNSGRFVDVKHGLGWLKPGDEVHVSEGDMVYRLRVEKETGYFWWCRGFHDLSDINGKTCRFGAIPDHFLWPIRPPKPAVGEPRIIELEKQADEP